MTEPFDLVMAHGTVITMDDNRQIIPDGSVAISGDRIVRVGPAADVEGMATAKLVDCRGRAIVPGFVDCHDHLFQNAARGLGEGLDLPVWLTQFMFPFALSMTREEAVVAVTMSVIEAARAGTTAVVDHHYAGTDLETTLEVVGAVEAVGLRGAIGRGIGEEQPFPLEQQLEWAAAAIDAKPPGSKVEIWPCPGNVPTNDQNLFRRSVELARSRNSGWHTHCSQHRTDAEVYIQKWGIRPVEWLHREGLLGPDGRFAHMIFLNDQEVEWVGASETRVAYCPISHGFHALGTMRLRDLREAGAVVGLGYDGAVSGFRTDMFEQMKMAALIQRLHTLDNTAVNSSEALELATREGARYLGIDAGVLAPGKLADIAVVSLQGAHMTPLRDPVAAVAYSARGSDVTMTIVGGEVVYENGRCTQVDEEAVMAEAQARSDALLARIDLPVLRT